MDAPPPRTLRWCVAGVVCLFALLQLAEIGRYRTVGGDETYYMEAAYTMLRSGDWLIPRYADGGLRFEKPIATYWAVAACSWVFGFSVWATRLHSVILALATLPYAFGLGRVTLRSRTGGLLSVLVYASIKSVHANAHQGRTDAILSFFVAAAMFHFARALLDGRRPRRDAVLGHAFTAGALLTKGMAGALYTYLPLAVFALLARKRLAPGRTRALLSPWGLATLAALVVPWFAYVLATHTEEFLRVFITDQVTANVGLDQPFFVASLLSYVVLFVRETFPWWPFLLLALALDRPALRQALAGRRAEWLLHVSWLVVAVVVLSLANTTRGRYLLPTFPGLAVFVAALLSASGEGGRAHRGLAWAIHALSVAAVGLALVFLAMQVGPLAPHDLTWVGVPTLALVAASLWLSRRARRLDLYQATGAVAALSLALLSCANAMSEPPAPLCQVAELGREVIAREPDDTHVAVVAAHPRELATVLLFSAGRRPTEVQLVRDPRAQVEAVRAFLRAQGRRLLLLEERSYAVLPESLKARMVVVDQRSGLLRHGLRAPPPAALEGLPSEWLAEVDTVRLLAPVETPR